MSQPSSPLAAPDPWNTVAEGYAVDIVPFFSRYAEDAIALAELPADAHLLDVAAGPGTLSLIAARRAGRVVALDFAEDMVNIIRRRIAEENVTNLEAMVGNGQALPFPDASFDAAFSMFGLIFFPDRAAGFRELFRVLKPERRAVVSSWGPLENVPILASLFEAIRSIIPDLPFGREKGPLSDVDEFREEMSGAGFRSVEIHIVEHMMEIPSVQLFWETQARSSVGLALLRKKMSEAEWDDFSARLVAQLEDEFGAGTLESRWQARLGVGVR